MTREGRSASKKWLSWLVSLLSEGSGASSISRRLHKKRNVDFLLRKFDVVVDVRDDDPSKLSQGTNEEAT